MRLKVFQSKVKIYGASLDSLIIHAKNMMHTCVANFMCTKPNSRAQKTIHVQKNNTFTKSNSHANIIYNYLFMKYISQM